MIVADQATGGHVRSLNDLTAPRALAQPKCRNILRGRLSSILTISSGGRLALVYMLHHAVGFAPSPHIVPLG